MPMNERFVIRGGHVSVVDEIVDGEDESYFLRVGRCHSADEAIKFRDRLNTQAARIAELMTLPHAEDCGYWSCGTCGQSRFECDRLGHPDIDVHNWHPGKCNCPLSEVD